MPRSQAPLARSAPSSRASPWQIHPRRRSRSFQGFLKVAAGTPIGLTGVRGRQNERREFLITTTLPRSDDVALPVSQLVFPHIASGGGYTTQFIIFGEGSGRLRVSPPMDVR